MPKRKTPAAPAMTETQRLRALISPSPAALLQSGLPQNAWDKWDRRYGPLYRALHGIASEADYRRINDLEPVEPAEIPPPPLTS